MKSILLAAAFALVVSTASAHEYKAGSIEIKHPWARATPKGATVAGGYMKFINTGTTSDRLIGRHQFSLGEVPRIHEMSMDGDVIEDAACCQRRRDQARRNGRVQAGSYHLMFVGLKRPFEQGKRVKGSLQFEKAGTVEVEYAVEAIGARPKMDHDMGAMDHGGMKH